jgi:hypothetical protein
MAQKRRAEELFGAALRRFEERAAKRPRPMTATLRRAVASALERVPERATPQVGELPKIGATQRRVMLVAAVPGHREEGGLNRSDAGLVVGRLNELATDKKPPRKTSDALQADE